MINNILYLLSGALLLSTATPANYLPEATQTYGGQVVRWKSNAMPLKVFSYDCSKPAHSVNCKALEEALKLWKPVNPYGIHFKSVTEQSQADVVVSFYGRSPYSTAQGSTSLTKNANKTFTIPMYVIVYQQTQQGRSLNQGERSLVLAHELGHVLGIWGHSKEPLDLMAAQTRASKLSARDIATLRLLYQLPPTYVNADKAQNDSGL